MWQLGDDDDDNDNLDEKNERRLAAEGDEDDDQDVSTSAAVLPKDDRGDGPSQHQKQLTFDVGASTEIARQTEKVSVMRRMLQDAEALGDSKLCSMLNDAITQEMRRARARHASRPDIAEALHREFETREREILVRRKETEDLFRGDVARRKTIAQMREEQKRIEDARRQLIEAHTLAAVAAAVKSFDLDDLGLQHPKGGTASHRSNRMDVLDRIMRRGRPLPPELQNDWEFFKKHWDKNR